MCSFNVRNVKNDLVDAEDGVATIDWVVILAALTGLGVALVDVTSAPLGGHAQNVRGELQDNVFETAWTDSIPVGPSGEGVPDVLQTSGSTNDGTTDGETTDGGSTDGGTTDGGTTDGGSTDDGTTDDGTTDDGTTDDGTTDDGTTTDPDPSGGGTSTPSGPIVPTSNIQGCPDSSSYIADPVAKTGEQIEDNRIRVNNMTVGGATTNLVNCPGISGIGHFYANPTYTLDLSGMTDDFWRFQVHTRGDCDTGLVVQDAAGNLHFDDDSGNDFNARVRLFDMADLNGRINIWVGTYWGDTCDDVDLVIRVWD
ncbi:MAG TPA: hypothetical protein VKA18_15890 [Alphaproteobacteria bacterium]|nr:hypothetical protein [Alphaproteobacteria bacterium]